MKHTFSKANLEYHYIEINRSDGVCGDISIYAIQKMEIMAETIRNTNKNEHILPNVTVGFTFLDDCSTTRVSRSQVTWLNMYHYYMYL